MLTLIHGDDITKSRQFYISLKEQYPDASSVEGQDIDLTILKQILEGGSFFTEDKIIFIENLVVKKKNSTDFKGILTYISNPDLSAQIYLWEGKELEKNILSQFKNQTIRLFKLPQSLFIFLDALRPSNGKQLLQLFHQALQTMEEEALFYMIVRHFRILLALQVNNTTIEEVKRMQDWQKSKLVKQAKLFSEKKLLELYDSLFYIESGLKTGNLSGSLSSSIDIFLLGV